MAARLTTTSYAVLGLLALHPWSAYDLTLQYERSLRFAWPASLTKLYSEPKKLVDAGLAGAQEVSAGPRRTRTEYRITAAGRDALAAWLRTPAALPELGNEGMLRLAFADQGRVADLDTALAGLRADLQDWYEAGLEQLRGYLVDGGPYPARMHLIVHAAEFHARYLELHMDWIDEVRASLTGWNDGHPGLTDPLRARLEALLRRGEQRVGHSRAGALNRSHCDDAAS